MADIDLSAGLQPVSTGNDIDLSAGLQPVGSRPAQPENAGSWTPSLTTRVKDAASAAIAQPGQALLGAAKQGYQLIKSGMPQNDTVGQVDESGYLQPVPPSTAPNPLEPTGAAQKAGATAMNATAAAASAVGGVRSIGSAIRAAKNYFDVAPALGEDAVNVLNRVAAREGLPEIKADNLRDATTELQKNFAARAAQKYGVVDDAVGGDLKPLQQNIRDLTTQLRNTANEGEKLALAKQINTAQGNLNGLIDKAKANGVPDAEELMKSADADYARGTAGDNAKKFSKAMRVATNVAKTENGDPHPGTLNSQVGMLEYNKVLDKVLGRQGANEMIETAKTGRDAAMDLANRSAAAKDLAKKAALATGVAGASAAGVAGYEALAGKK